MLRRLFRSDKPFYKWSKFPQVIQVDTNNHCGPKHCGLLCSYCYPQWKIAQGEREYKEMPMEWIEWILHQIAKDGRTMGFIDWFLNGDLLTELRGHEIYALSKKINPWLRTQSFTNGVLYRNIDLALDKNLDRVCFTISGHTPELWAKVHRGPPKLFDRAITSLERCLDEGKPTEVHCVITQDNAPHLKEWYHYFSKYPDLTRVISPLVGSYDNQPSRTALGHLTLEEQEQMVIDIAGETGRMWTRQLIPDMKPCVLWDNMSIDVEGYVLNCCNWSPPQDVNYGLIPELMEEGRSLKDVWIERLANRMRNRLCRSCNMRHLDWEKRLADMKITVEVG